MSAIITTNEGESAPKVTIASIPVPAMRAEDIEVEVDPDSARVVLAAGEWGSSVRIALRFRTPIDVSTARVTLWPGSLRLTAAPRSGSAPEPRGPRRLRVAEAATLS
jgi:hypothetical protein